MKNLIFWIVAVIAAGAGYTYWKGKQAAATVAATPSNPNAIASFWGPAQQAQVTATQNSVNGAIASSKSILDSVTSIFGGGSKGSASPQTSTGGSPAPVPTTTDVGQSSVSDFNASQSVDFGDSSDAYVFGDSSSEDYGD